MDETFIIANRTDVGKTREVNEDSMVTFDSPNGRVIAVCDGMGGQAAGDVASRLACDIISDILTNNKFTTPTEAITRACQAANQGILHRASQNPELEGMGATCVMVIIKDGLVYYGWVGDSRIYYVSKGTIRQISHDQSYVQQLVDSGQITAAEAENHPMKNEILNALGLVNMTPPQLCTAPLTPEPGSIIMLCSDGLSGMVDNETLETIISDPELSLQRKADKLVDRANVNGGLDNITVQLVQFGSPKGAAAGGNGAKAKGVKSNTILYAAIGAVVVAAGVIIGITLGKGDKKDKVDDIAPIVTTTTTTTGGSSSSTETNNVTNRTETRVVETTTRESSRKKESNRGGSTNAKDKTFGKGHKDSGKTGKKEVEKLPKTKEPKEPSKENHTDVFDTFEKDKGGTTK